MAVVLVVVVVVVSGQTEQKSNNNLLLELLPNLLTPRAAAIIVGLVRHLGSYQGTRSRCRGVLGAFDVVYNLFVSEEGR